MVINIPWYYAVLFLVVLIGLSAAWSRWQLNRRRSAIARQVAQLGLQPVSDTDPELQQRFQRLRRERVERPRIALAWKRDEAFGRIYVLELWIKKDDAPALQGGYILVVSPQLSLPRFGLFPQLTAKGLIAPLVTKCQNYVIGRLGPVAFDDHPEFARDYVVVGDDETAVRQFLTKARRLELGRLKGRLLEAEGDMFSYSRTDPQDQRPTGQWTEMRDRLEEARRLFDALKTG